MSANNIFKQNFKVDRFSRAKKLDGKLVIDSKINEGTKLTVTTKLG